MERIQAIVLGTSPYSETTLNVRLLTREQGVVRALAKGARRLQKKGGDAQAAFEPCAVVEAMVALKAPDALGTLGEIRLIRAWPWMRHDLARLAYGGLGVEVLSAVAGQSPHDPFFYDEAVEFLDRLERTEAAGSLTLTLMLRLLHEAGFPPRMDERLMRKLETSGAIALPSVLSWNFAAGRLEPVAAGEARHAMRLEAGVIAPLLAGGLDCFEEPPEWERAPVWKGGAGPLAIRWMIRVWEEHLNHPLKSADFLEKMVLL